MLCMLSVMVTMQRALVGKGPSIVGCSHPSGYRDVKPVQIRLADWERMKYGDWRLQKNTWEVLSEQNERTYRTSSTQLNFVPNTHTGCLMEIHAVTFDLHQGKITQFILVSNPKQHAIFSLNLWTSFWFMWRGQAVVQEVGGFVLWIQCVEISSGTLNCPWRWMFTNR